MLKIIFLALGLFFFWGSQGGCTKKTEIVPVTNNPPPPDNRYSRVVAETYVNKLYITLLGRKADTSELKHHTRALLGQNFSQSVRNAVIDSIMKNRQYYFRVYDIAREEMLPGTDTLAVNRQIRTYQQILRDSSRTNRPLVLIELEKMIALRDAPHDLANKKIDVREMYRRVCFNVKYDMVNMGTQNYVLSVFENFYHRLPTQEELKNGMAIVDNTPAQLFFKEGTTKADFLNIMLSGFEYYEGQVTALYRRHLLRNPNSSEMTTLARQYRTNGRYEDIQKVILASDEYLGIGK